MSNLSLRSSLALLTFAAAALCSPSAHAQAGDVLAIAFDAQNPPSAAEQARLQAQFPRPEYFVGPRWSGAQGSPRVVTWSLVPDGVQVPSMIGENAAFNSLFARMDGLFTGQGGRAGWIQRVQESFDRWEQLSGIDFVRVSAPGQDWDDGAAWGSQGNASRGDIRIVMKRLDSLGGVTAVASFPGGGDIVLDRNENWGDAANLNRFLRNNLMWAQGIASGVDLSCPNDGTKLMEPL
ncbi:MAG: hypothetical protein ACKO4Q_00615, partial [Planctomycetota bacterium]